jgi:hypothetical protein
MRTPGQGNPPPVPFGAVVVVGAAVVPTGASVVVVEVVVGVVVVVVEVVVGVVVVVVDVVVVVVVVGGAGARTVESHTGWFWSTTYVPDGGDVDGSDRSVADRGVGDLVRSVRVQGGLGECHPVGPDRSHPDLRPGGAGQVEGEAIPGVLGREDDTDDHLRGSVTDGVVREMDDADAGVAGNESVLSEGPGRTGGGGEERDEDERESHKSPANPSHNDDHPIGGFRYPGD